jgi:hypothetical protein
MSGGTVLDQIEITLRSRNGNFRNVWIDVADNSLSRKWLAALNSVLDNQLHLEKNYCFLGWANSDRNGELILDQVNRSVDAINAANLGYQIVDHYSMSNCITDDPVDGRTSGRNIVNDKLNWLHRYFEDLQGVSGNMSPYYTRADSGTRWHIRQLNLLCHEFECWALSYRKQIEAPAWQRPSQLMCWLNAPRFELTAEDYELFGIETINRPLGGVFVGVNKAVGKHHFEVFKDEGRDSRIGELTTSTLKSQTEAAADFDIEWAQDPGQHEFQQRTLSEFRQWLIANNFDPADPVLTIGHPQVGQVDLLRSFGTDNYSEVWVQMSDYLDVYSVKTSDAQAVYNYHWSDFDFPGRQIDIIKGN